MYYTYMLICNDNSIYTGITNDVKRRFQQHCAGKGAKYTISHKPQKIIAVFSSKDKSIASKLEYKIKQLTKKQKEYIYQNKNLKVLEKYMDIKQYRYEGQFVG